MRPQVIAASHDKADSVRPPIVELDATLHFVAKVAHQGFETKRRIVVVPGRQALLPHPPTETFGVGRQPGDGHAHVIVENHDFLLVRRQLGRGSLQGHDHGVTFALQPHGGRALFHGLHGVLDLVEAALG